MPKKFSTKNLTVVEEPTPERMGVGVFEFTDDYSIFHYGKMPDRITDKGEAICRMASHNFGLLANAGIRTHFRRFQPPNCMEFDLVRVIDPAVQPIAAGTRSYFIPLQVVYRNQLPPGASVFRRLDDGTVTLEQLGLSRPPTPGERLERPIVEFTTKLEEIDRFITPGEARAISGLDERQLARVRELALEIDAILTRKAESVGLEHADGKIEFGVSDQGEIILVDNAGTPDENRFLYRGVHIGKQVLRDHYLASGIEKQVQRWAAAGRPRSTWPAPDPLPYGFVHPIADMYRSLCERWTGERVWAAPGLDEVVESLRTLDPGVISW